jgi:K+-sensing histidine kinase KdpD
MFAPFERLSATHGTACVGLGLTLARGLTEAMRGMPGTGEDVR